MKPKLPITTSVDFLDHHWAVHSNMKPKLHNKHKLPITSVDILDRCTLTNLTYPLSPLVQASDSTWPWVLVTHSLPNIYGGKTTHLMLFHIGLWNGKSSPWNYMQVITSSQNILRHSIHKLVSFLDLEQWRFNRQNTSVIIPCYKSRANIAGNLQKWFN
jgi:hypothetical protein